VVVDLAVDGKGDGLILVGDGLCAGVCVLSVSMRRVVLLARGMFFLPTPTMLKRSWTRMVLLAMWLPLQSGPRCLTCLPMRMAVGLNFCTSGCLCDCQYVCCVSFATSRVMTYWWQAKIPHMLAVL
jgi:hypothetical protein